jgi:hypothetical protein
MSTATQQSNSQKVEALKSMASQVPVTSSSGSNGYLTYGIGAAIPILVGGASYWFVPKEPDTSSPTGLKTNYKKIAFITLAVTILAWAMLYFATTKGWV